MTPILSLMRDLDAAIAHASIEGREATMRGVTDLLVCDIERLSEEQVAIVEEVIARLAPVVGRDARAELARRLAPLPKAPSGIVRSLARDDIEVARPVLVHSLGLADADLVAVATAQGIDHRQAIAERRQISEVVTDVLVARGDRGVLHALARNVGARWSKEGAAVLADRARDDTELQQWL